MAGLGRAVEQITNKRRARLVAGNALEDERADSQVRAYRVHQFVCMRM